MNPTRRLILRLAAALSVLSCTATAKSYPTRLVRIIVSLAAGGTPDIICRIVAERLPETIGVYRCWLKPPRLIRRRSLLPPRAPAWDFC